MIQEEIAKNAAKQQYTVPKVPVHVHNNIDAPNIPIQNVTTFAPLPGTGNGVISPDTLQDQVVDVLSNATPGESANSFVPISVKPVPIIYGSGSTVSITWTSTVSAGATSATLSSSWGGTTGVYAVQFGTFQAGGEIRNVTLTNSATTATWTTPLVGSYSVDATVNGTAAFNGGDAPPGTMLFFVNGDQSPGVLDVVELWIKIDNTDSTALSSWYGISLDLSVG